METKEARAQNINKSSKSKGEFHPKDRADNPKLSDSEVSLNTSPSPDIFRLPRLGHAGKKRDGGTSHREDTENATLKFPEIIVSKNSGRLALNRSITDLLDPEMEILNKIKHMPRKKQRRKRQKGMYSQEALLLKQDPNVEHTDSTDTPRPK